MSRDMVKRPGANLYLYCENEPVNNVDPTGLDAITVNGKRGKWTFDKGKTGFTITFELTDPCCKNYQLLQVTNAREKEALIKPVKGFEGVMSGTRFPWQPVADGGKGSKIGHDFAVDRPPANAKTPFFGGGDPKKVKAGDVNQKQIASMFDENVAGFPGDFEVCAICIDDGRVLSCLKWSNRKDAAGPSESGNQSNDFDNAVKDWNDWAAGNPNVKPVPQLKNFKD